MIGKSPNQNQLNLFKPVLKQFINPSHPLVLLAERIPCSELEKDFSPLYSNTGTPAKPIRLMIGLLLLKVTIMMDQQEEEEQKLPSHWQAQVAGQVQQTQVQSVIPITRNIAINQVSQAFLVATIISTEISITLEIKGTGGVLQKIMRRMHGTAACATITVMSSESAPKKSRAFLFVA